MKAALVQQAARTTTGTQDWTDANIASDLVLPIFFGSQAVANDTLSAQFRQIIGATDLTNETSVTLGTMSDGATGASSQLYISNAGSLMQTNVSPSVTVAAVRSATLPAGLTMNYATVNGTAYLENCLLLSGADIEASVIPVSFNSTDTSKLLSHGLSGAVDIIIMAVAVGVASAPSGGGTVSIFGVYERAGGTMAGLGFRAVHAANPTDISAKISSDLGHAIGAAGADAFTMSVSSLTSTQLTLNRSASASTSFTASLICIRAKTGTMASKCGLLTTPTAVGNGAAITGMATSPQVVLTFATRMTAAGSVVTDDSAGSYGIGITVNNNGTVQQLATASTMKDAVASSVAKCQTSNTKGILVLDNTGAAKIAATLTLNSDGFTPNYSAVDASNACQVGYLAFNVVSAASGKLLSAINNQGGF